MNPREAVGLSEILKALAHPTRLQILDELRGGVKCVTDMEDLLPVTQVNISQHLTVLRYSRLVDYAQDGALRCYYVSRPSLVEGLLSLLKRDHPVVVKTKEQINREKNRSRRIKEARCA